MNLVHSLSRLTPPRPVETPTVFIVDGDDSLRQGLELLIRSAGWEPRTSASAEEFLTCPPMPRPGCLLVELHLPGLSGLALQRILFERLPMPVIFMSGTADIKETVQAMKGGALEFLTKPLARDVLLSSIHHAIERSHSALRHLDRICALQQRYETLSRREREVMELVISGRLNKQVGSELGISEITVKAHRGKMMRKMKAGSLPELINMVASLHGGDHLPTSVAQPASYAHSCS
jgi:FixJ family two-component response regulator